MSDLILKALMQLFAIIARINDENKDEVSKSDYNAHQIIREFLKLELVSTKIEHYVDFFNSSYENLKSRKKAKYGESEKRTSVNSVKVLRICNEINKELSNKQRFIVLTRILELIIQDGNPSELELAFIKTIRDTFKINDHDFELIFNLLQNNIDLTKIPDDCLVIHANANDSKNEILLKGLDAPIICIHIKGNDILFFKYLGEEEIYLNGQVIDRKKSHIFPQGTTVNTSKSERLYQVDVFNYFLPIQNDQRFLFTIDKLRYEFPNGGIGIEDFNLSIESGNLVGVMGASGSGKTTLINILTGAKKPSSGSVSMNGVNIHQNSKQIEGRIGYVPQEDLLMGELTVFQNLYFSAKLSFGNLSEIQLKKRVLKTLNELGLNHIRNHKVGSPLQKVISGGQRKRLNIALELIRNPSLLFVDEPTSGLSSSGSLHVMNLLKDLTLKGTLVFVVIHQPSSDIFKLFNRLLILDVGGKHIYDDKPTNAIPYFKSALSYANPEDQGCSFCGNVNPEEIFEIIESSLLDEFGFTTHERKISPKRWNEIFLQNKQKEQNQPKQIPQLKLPTPIIKPNKISQFKTFFNRDFISKFTNRQYKWLILAEAPVLAFLMAFFLKYYVDIDNQKSYVFYYNENIHIYFFVSILVATFLGMMVASEEIVKDRKNLKRERFLHLSWGSYLLGKTSILFIISAIQALLYVLVGNLILEIKELWFFDWLVLFSISFWSNMLGLNISSLFKQTKLIYVLIPIMIIPQMIFSGLLIRYDRMNPLFSHPYEVPWIGNLMISRWGYEALATSNATENSFAKLTYQYKKTINESGWKKNYWVPEMKELIHENKHLELIQNEIEKEEGNWENLNCESCFENGQLNQKNIQAFVATLEMQYNHDYNAANDSLDLFKQKYGIDKYNLLRDQFNNEKLEWLVTARQNLDKIYIDYDQKVIYQLKAPIYQSSSNIRFFDSPYFIKEKSVLGFTSNTYWANIIVIWLFTLFLYLCLHFEVFTLFLKKYKAIKGKFKST